MRHQHCIKVFSFLLAGAVVLGWSSRVGAQQPAPSQQAQDKAGQVNQQAGGMTGKQLPQGVTPTKASSDQIQKLHEVVRQAVQNALSKGNLEKVADSFIGRDRDRFTDSTISSEELDRTIDQFNNQWRSKYNTDFNIANQDQSLNTVQPQIGQVTDPQQLASRWPIGQGAQQGTEVGELQGRQIAVLQFPPAQQGSPGVTASLVQNEKGDWKFDIPNSIDAQTLSANLIRQINNCIKMSNSWPKDPNQTYAMVSGQIIQAFYDISGAGGQGAQPGQQPSQSSQPPPQSGQQSPQTGPQPMGGATTTPQGGL